MVTCFFMKGNPVVKFKIEMEELKQVAFPMFWGSGEKILSAFGR